METKESPKGAVSGNNYVKHLGYPDTCNVTVREQKVQTDTADISASGERCWPFAPTFHSEGIECKGSAKVNADHSGTVTLARLKATTVTLTCSYSGTLVIDDLECDTVDIDCRYSSTIHIKRINAQTVNFNVIYASTLRFDEGKIHFAKGLVDYASTGRSRAKIDRDDVRAEHASTWDSQAG